MNFDELSALPRSILAIAERLGISVEEAKKLMDSAKVKVVCGQKIKESVHLQIALHTVINICKRSFLGGVSVEIPSKTQSLIKSYVVDLDEHYSSLVLQGDNSDYPFVIYLGGESKDNSSCEIICNDWQGGVNLKNHKVELHETKGMLPFGAIASASIACNLAFTTVYKLDNSELEANGISIWNLETNDWHDKSNSGLSEINLMPDKLWFVGLGHLGQAYLWLLSFIPYTDRDLVSIILQDFDIVSASNKGSQLLVEDNNINDRKTRVCSTFLERLGFKTSIIEKAFEKSDQHQNWRKDYKILINGLDNAETRLSLDTSAFDLILDGATNGKEEFFDSFTIRNLSRMKKKPSDIWGEHHQDDFILHPKIFKEIEDKGGCGLAINHSISTPFIGCFTATIVMGELFRSFNNGSEFSIISGELRNVGELRKVSVN